MNPNNFLALKLHRGLNVATALADFRGYGGVTAATGGITGIRSNVDAGRGIARLAFARRATVD